MGAHLSRARGTTRALALAFVMEASVMVAGSAAPRVARAEPAAASSSSEADAREAFARGRAAYDAGDFEAAAQAFERAYQLSGKAGLLYNLYLAFRDANRQAQAAEALRSYLARDPDAPNRPQLEARLKALEAGLAERAAQVQAASAAEPEPTPAAPQAAAPTESPAVLAPATSTSPPYWRGPVIVMASGAALALASIAPGMIAVSKANELDDKCTSSPCDPALGSVEDTRRRAALSSDVLLFSGLATTAAGAVWFFVRRGREHRPPAVSAACLPGGCSAFYTTRF
jgi:tetratricopeptide (TPR) repeat protein